MTETDRPTNRPKDRGGGGEMGHREVTLSTMQFLIFSDAFFLDKIQ